jgi:hypothetical protein
MAQAPAICDTCRTVFPSGFELAEGSSASFAGSKAGPCPKCHGWGTIPDGLYEFVGDTLRIISDWTPERRQQFANELQAAKAQPDPQQAALAAFTRQPELGDMARRLLVPRNAGEFWAFIATILTAVALLGGQVSDTTNVNVQTVIQACPTPEAALKEPSASRQPENDRRPPPQRPHRRRRP